MMRQGTGEERANLAIREVELARAAERARRFREATIHRRRRDTGRIRAAIVSALRSALDRLEPAASREPQLGREGGC